MINARLGVVAPGDPSNVLTWSGVPYFMTNALRPHFKELIPLSAGSLSFSEGGMRVDRWSRRLFGRGYLPGIRYRDLQRRARSVTRQIEEKGVDAVFAITVDPLIAFLDGAIPVVHHSDSTFAAMEGYYPAYSTLWRLSRKRADEFAARALARSDIVTFPSQWAAASAIRDYHVDPAKVHVIQYGANIATTPPDEDIDLLAAGRRTCQLLFMGGAWERKGGKTVLATLDELLERNLDVNLIVVGCDPGVRHEKIEVVPFLNKQIPEDRTRYIQLWRESAFLFVPSHQETFGAIFAEAAANALPVISRQTGGIPDAVEHGVSGHLLPEDAAPAAYADTIEKIWTTPEKYRALMRGARDRYESVLNWDTWARRTSELFKSLLTG